jgi:hypothetical protein
LRGLLSRPEGLQLSPATVEEYGAAQDLLDQPVVDLVLSGGDDVGLAMFERRDDPFFWLHCDPASA